MGWMMTIRMRISMRMGIDFFLEMLCCSSYVVYFILLSCVLVFRVIGCLALMLACIGSVATDIMTETP